MVVMCAHVGCTNHALQRLFPKTFCPIIYYLSSLKVEHELDIFFMLSGKKQCNL